MICASSIKKAEDFTPTDAKKLKGDLKLLQSQLAKLEKTMESSSKYGSQIIKACKW